MLYVLYVVLLGSNDVQEIAMGHQDYIRYLCGEYLLPSLTMQLAVSGAIKAKQKDNPQYLGSPFQLAMLTPDKARFYAVPFYPRHVQGKLA